MRTIVKVFLFNQKSIDLKGKKELTKYMSKIRTKKRRKDTHIYVLLLLPLTIKVVFIQNEWTRWQNDNVNGQVDAIKVIEENK